MFLAVKNVFCLKITKSHKNFRYTVKKLGKYSGFFIVVVQKAAVDNIVSFSL